MTDSLATTTTDATPDGWTPLSAAEFRSLYEAMKVDACARALAPILSERPALLRAIERDDATVLWCVGQLSPRDQVIDAVAIIPDGGGSFAAVVRDTLLADREALATVIAAKVSPVPVVPHIASRSNIHRLVSARDVMAAVGCSKSAAYRHLREAAGRPNGTGKTLRVPVDTWERYAKRAFGR